MTNLPRRSGCKFAAILASLAAPVPVASQSLPDGAGYPTAPTTTRAPRPRPAPAPPRGGGMIEFDRPAPDPVRAAAPVELPPPDVQLANGWITQEQYDQLETQIRGQMRSTMREFEGNVADARRAQEVLADRQLDAISAFLSTSDPNDGVRLLQEMGYTPPPGAATDDPRRLAESFVTVLETTVQTEQNVGRVMRPGVQGFLANIDSGLATNIEMMRATGRVPPETLRQYTDASRDIHNRVIARVDRLFYEHDREVENSARVLRERRDRAIETLTRAVEQQRERYGPDPRNWPQSTTPARQPRPQRFSYIGILTQPPAAPTPSPAPRPNPRNLPALGGDDRRPPIPQDDPGADVPPGPAVDPNPPVPPPGRRPVRRGEIPPADPFAGLRVEQRPQPTPRRRQPPPQPVRLQERPTPQLPDPVILQQREVDPETGRDRNNSGPAPSEPSLLDSIMARIPRTRDGSIDWARVPISIRAQIILYQHRQRTLAGGGGGGGGFGEGGGNSSDAALVAELTRRLDEELRLEAAAQRRARQDANWQQMVDARFAPNASIVDQNYVTSQGRSILMTNLEQIYGPDSLERGNVMRSLSAAGTGPSSLGNSLSSAGNSLSSVGWSLSSAGTDWRDPALESLHEAMGLFRYRSRSNGLQSGMDGDPARAAQMAYNAGAFDVRFNRGGLEHLESGGPLAASLFTMEEWYLRQLTANGQGGLDRLLAQPFNVLLTWGANAFDLDLHMTGPTGEGNAERFHIYYAAAGSLTGQPFAQLIRDCICASGSEVVLTSALQRGGVYRVSVFNFGDQSATSMNLANMSDATIEIVRGGTAQSVGNGTTIVGGRTILRTKVTPGRAGNTWVAVELDPRNGRITVPGRILQSPGSGGVQ